MDATSARHFFSLFSVGDLRRLQIVTLQPIACANRFEEVEVIADGLGPTYNAQSCAECHQNVVTGGASQIAEHRTGRVDASGGFFESLGGSLIHSRATNPAIDHSSLQRLPVA